MGMYDKFSVQENIYPAFVSVFLSLRELDISIIDLLQVICIDIWFDGIEWVGDRP